MRSIIRFRRRRSRDCAEDNDTRDRHIMADPKINTHSERDVVKRYVVGLNENGKSAVLMDGVPNQQELKDWFWRAALWKTRETPADNTLPGDRSRAGGAPRGPAPDGLLARGAGGGPAQKSPADL